MGHNSPMLLAEAITEATTVTISLKVLATMFGFAGSLVGVYVASLRRDDRMEGRIVDLERWQNETWGGPGGHKQELASLRRWQLESRGAERVRGRTHDYAKTTLGPGNDTIT